MSTDFDKRLSAQGSPRWRTSGNEMHLDLESGWGLEGQEAFHVGILMRAFGPGSLPRELLEIGGPHLRLRLLCQAPESGEVACSLTPVEGAVVRVDPALLDPAQPNALFVTCDPGRYLTLFVNGKMVEFSPVSGDMPSAPGGVRATVGGAWPACIESLVIGRGVPAFADRYRLHRAWQERCGRALDPYPILQPYGVVLGRPGVNLRDPSEVLHIGGRYYVYFTRIPEPVRDGFIGSVWCSSCADSADPSRPESWSDPVEVIPRGDPARDHDGTGCFTPDCFHDGRHVYVFYTALNSTAPRGFPSWPEPRCPEHIMVARSERPDGGFVKTPKHTPLSPATRALDYDEATVPGGHETLDGEALFDVSLIDHGQCWVMDDGERRYYYKGGGAGKGGAVCMMRGFDAHWLNGRRPFRQPIINEGAHMEGILITRVDDQLWLQLMVRRNGWEWLHSYVSAADDGIRWRHVGLGHRLTNARLFSLSMGVHSPVEPRWGIGQVPLEDGRIGLAYLKVV